ncbi:ABC transporter permease [Caldicellulosiruptor sp. DIB 104C]|uniref:ABC transporter permease n=1 Tax=Caldicellulosiruptor sp. DIB 104C TaxID=3019889 RepID=UPI002304DCA4|nr:ABC transporter permease subunit [Caldicellulosiruptor sp. DIB 104C]
MKDLIKNEIIKMFYRKKILIGLAVILIFSVVGVWGTIAIIKATSPENEIKITQQKIANLKKERMKTKDPIKKQKIDEQILQSQAYIDNLKISMKSTDWKKDVKNQLDKLKKSMKEATDLSLLDSKEYYREQILEYEYCLKKSIKPYTLWQINNWTVMNIFLGLIIFLLPFIVFIFASDIVSNEISQKTISLLVTRPISRFKIALSKFISATIVCSALVIISEILVFIITGLLYGFIDLKYPITVGTRYRKHGLELIPIYGSTYIVPLGKFLIYALLLQLLIITACCALSFFISAISKSNSTANTLSFLMVYGIYFIVSPISQAVSKINFLKAILLYTYLNPLDILENNIATNVMVSIMTPFVSILVLFGYIVIFLSTSLKIFNKKDLLV